MVRLAGLSAVLFLISNLSYQIFAEYTEKEKQALQRFRAMVNSELYRDFMRRDEYLIRWIRNQKFDLRKAEEKLKAANRWRKMNKVDNIFKEDFSDVEKLCHFSLDGRDKLGKSILTLEIGNWGMRKLVLSGNIEKLRRMMFYVFELRSKLINDAQLKGSPNEDGLVIADFNNFRLRDQGCIACLPVLFEVLTLYDAYYPQYVYGYLFINTPWALETLLPMVLPKYLSEKTTNGLHVYGLNVYDWRDAIRKYAASDQVEASFGGTKAKPPPVSEQFKVTLGSSTEKQFIQLRLLFSSLVLTLVNSQFF